MNFKEWLNNEQNFLTEVAKFLVDLKTNALRSLRVENGRLSLSFRPSAVALPRNNTAAAEPQMALAAHTTYDGDTLSEATADDERAHRHDKGWTAYRGLEKLTDPVSALGWDKKQQYRFKSNLTHAVADIAQPLGFLFELEVFICLRDKFHMHDGDKGRMNVDVLRQEYIKTIEGRLGQAKQQILQMLEVHAEDLAKQIVARTTRMLGCADMIWFTGGKNTSYTGRSNPADIQIGCSEYSGEDDRVGYSVKFGSETRISIAKLTPKTAIEAAMGRITHAQFNSLPMPESFENEKEWTAETSRVLYEIISPKYEDNPTLFVKLLNNLLSGGNNTFPAARNYASTEMGGAEWSGNFRKDFIVGDNALRARSDAKIEMDYNKTYFRMTYLAPNGSVSGTTLFFVPRSGMIDVKVNNLTSGRR